MQVEELTFFPCQKTHWLCHTLLLNEGQAMQSTFVAQAVLQVQRYLHNVVVFCACPEKQIGIDLKAMGYGLNCNVSIRRFDNYNLTANCTSMKCMKN